MPTGSPLLAFDTSTERLAVALQGRHDVHLADELGGAAASAGLLPCIERLLAEADLRWTDIETIAFGRGPGAFTGLRTSCAVAQGLAIGLSRRLHAIDSLLIVAEDARRQALVDSATAADTFDVDVVMDARIGELYAGRFVWHASGWKTAHAATLCSPQWLLERWAMQPPAWLAGSALEVFPALSQTLPATTGRTPLERSRASALLALAQAARMDGPGVDAADALPLYLRDKVALTTLERELARRGSAAIP